MGKQIKKNYEENPMKNQKMNELRRKCRLAKAESQFTYKEMAQIIGYDTNAFYNFLNGDYNLSWEKSRILEELLSDLLD